MILLQKKSRVLFELSASSMITGIGFTVFKRKNRIVTPKFDVRRRYDFFRTKQKKFATHKGVQN